MKKKKKKKKTVQDIFKNHIFLNFQEKIFFQIEIAQANPQFPLLSFRELKYLVTLNIRHLILVGIVNLKF